jgi:hypothetical protein
VNENHFLSLFYGQHEIKNVKLKFHEFSISVFDMAKTQEKMYPLGYIERFLDKQTKIPRAGSLHRVAKVDNIISREVSFVEDIKKDPIISLLEEVSN